MAKHARISPSAASRWIHCPGSVKATEHLPDTTSVYAQEGTLAHEICEMKLRHHFHLPMRGQSRPVGKKTLEAFLERSRKNELYAPEMDGHTDEYVELIVDIANGSDGVDAVLVEARVDLDPYVPDGFGSADCILLTGTMLHVFDFKYGKGVPVSAEGNPQLRLYGLGAYRMLSYFYDITDIVTHVVQPRLGAYSYENIRRNDLLKWADYIQPQAIKAHLGVEEFAAGDWCRFCKIKATCRTRAEQAVGSVKAYEKKAANELTNEELGRLLAEAEEFTKWVKDAKDYAFEKALDGEKVEGWKLVAGRSSRSWIDQSEAFSALASAGYTEELLWHREPYTLAQIEKQIGKKAFDEACGEFVTKSEGKPALVRESDKRPEWSRVSAADDFKDV